MVNFNEHKQKTQEIANFYEINENKINRGSLRFSVNPDIALRLKSRLFYLTGGYAVSQTHIYNDAIAPTINGIFNNLDRLLSDPSSAIYDGLNITEEQVCESTRFRDAVCAMSKENKYRNKYISKAQIDNRFEKMYKHKPEYPDSTYLRKIDIQKDITSA